MTLPCKEIHEVYHSHDQDELYRSRAWTMWQTEKVHISNQKSKLIYTYPTKNQNWYSKYSYPVNKRDIVHFMGPFYAIGDPECLFLQKNCGKYKLILCSKVSNLNIVICYVGKISLNLGNLTYEL